MFAAHNLLLFNFSFVGSKQEAEVINIMAPICDVIVKHLEFSSFGGASGFSIIGAFSPCLQNYFDNKLDESCKGMLVLGN